VEGSDQQETLPLVGHVLENCPFSLSINARGCKRNYRALFQMFLASGIMQVFVADRSYVAQGTRGITQLLVAQGTRDITQLLVAQGTRDMTQHIKSSKRDCRSRGWKQCWLHFLMVNVSFMALRPNFREVGCIHSVILMASARGHICHTLYVQFSSVCKGCSLWLWRGVSICRQIFVVSNYR
jgi:hypothetical protein